MKPIDKEMLLIQVTAVVGCYGLLRSQEIKNLLFKDITLVQRKSITIGYQGYISKSKTDKIGKGFVVFIPNESNGSYNPGEIITTYIDQVKGANLYSDSREFLVPTKLECPRDKTSTKRVFCKGNLGKHKLASFPKLIAGFGHFFRRQGATMYSEAGISLDNLKRIGRWKCDNVASNYIHNSNHFKEINSKLLLESTTLTVEQTSIIYQQIESNDEKQK